MTYLTFSTEEEAIAAQAQINTNLSLPNLHGTTNWAEIQKAEDEDLWFFAAPPTQGWGNSQHFSKEEMLAELNNLVEVEDISG